MDLIGIGMSREDIGKTTGLKHKSLTQFIRAQLRSGALIRRLAYIDPVRGGKRKTIYNRCAQTVGISLQGAKP